MDLGDLSLHNGTLPKSNNVAIAASLFVMVESGRTMTGLIGDDRFSLPYGGELMGATYSGVLGILASVVVRSPLPAFAALTSIILCIAMYWWQEGKAIKYE